METGDRLLQFTALSATYQTVFCTNFLNNNFLNPNYFYGQKCVPSLRHWVSVKNPSVGVQIFDIALLLRGANQTSSPCIAIFTPDTLT